MAALEKLELVVSLAIITKPGTKLNDVVIPILRCKILSMTQGDYSRVRHNTVGFCMLYPIAKGSIVHLVGTM